MKTEKNDNGILKIQKQKKILIMKFFLVNDIYHLLFRPFFTYCYMYK